MNVELHDEVARSGSAAVAAVTPPGGATQPSEAARLSAELEEAKLNLELERLASRILAIPLTPEAHG